MSENRMAERKRLIELISQVQDYGEKTESGRCEVAVSHTSNEELAEHLIKNGVVVLPDIPFGTELFQIWGDKIHKLKLSSYMVREDNGEKVLQWHLLDSRGFNGGGNVNDFGKTVFLTKGEAEKALEQRKEDEGK